MGDERSSCSYRNGPRDIENGVCTLARRDTLEKQEVSLEELPEKLELLLEEIQKNMFEDCKKRMEEKTSVATNMDEFAKNLAEKPRFY